MADAKIEIKVGEVAFSGEGDSAWLASQLDKIIAKLPELSKVTVQTPKESRSGGAGHAADERKATGTLALFLKTKNATTNQIRKFLAAAVWLQDRESKDRLSTSDVTKALSDNHQSRLGNASECLNQNVSKGFCEKVGKEFYVTEEGRTELGS
jgi:hypothetical protein